MRRALLIEELEGPAAVATVVLEGGGYVCDWARTADDAVARVRNVAYDVLLLDSCIPDASGLITRLQEAGSTAPVLILSTTHWMDEDIQAVGAAGVVRYPVGQSLLAAIDRNAGCGGAGAVRATGIKGR